MAYIGRQNLGGAYRQLDDISSGFDGSDTTHTMQVNSQNVTVGDVNQIILSLGGVIQKPGTDFTVSGSVLTFTTAPAANTSFFAILLGSDNGGTVTPTDGSVTGDKIASDLSIATNVRITTADNTDTLSLISTDADANAGPNLRFYRNSSSPADDDVIGRVDFEGRNNNSEDIIYANIQGEIMQEADGSEDGQLQFGVMKAGTLRNAFTIDRVATVFNEDSQDIDFRVESDGLTHAMFVDGGNNLVHLGTSSSFGTFLNISGGSTHDIGIENSTASKSQIIAKNNSSTHNTQMMILQSIRTSTASFEYFRYIANDGGDVDMLADGNGNLKMDGQLTPGGIDYAEFFEWKDGNSSDEDRRGHSVVLDGDKIVVATSSDDTSKIIGIVSTHPSVLGGGDMEKWVHKYLRDDYDSPIWEEHTVTEWTDEDGKKHSYQTDKIPSDLTAPSDATVISEEKDRYGNTIKLKRKKLNPEWDSSKQYISRQDRKEWEAIGLMGKLRLKKGEPVNPNWIKLRDISDTVEEWLVR
jgi:hypothetical protein